jgi:hypothetical protein
MFTAQTEGLWSGFITVSAVFHGDETLAFMYDNKPYRVTGRDIHSDSDVWHAPSRPMGRRFLSASKKPSEDRRERGVRDALPGDKTRLVVSKHVAAKIGLVVT